MVEWLQLWQKFFLKNRKIIVDILRKILYYLRCTEGRYKTSERMERLNGGTKDDIQRDYESKQEPF